MDISGVDELTAATINATTYYNGPYNWNTITTTGDTYNVTSTDVVILADSSLNVITINLPAATTSGRLLYIKDSGGNSSTNNITLVQDGTDTIDGSTENIAINSNYTCYTILSNGSGGWFIM